MSRWSQLIWQTIRRSNLMNRTLRRSQGDGNVHCLPGIIHVNDDRAAGFGNQYVFGRINDFNQDTVGTILKSWNGGVNDRQILLQVFPRTGEGLAWDEMQRNRHNSGGHDKVDVVAAGLLLVNADVNKTFAG